MSIPANPSATSTFTPPKIFGDRRAELASRDLTDPDKVFELAVEVAAASDRRLMQVSIAELRALARLALATAPIATLAAQAAKVSDAGAGRAELKASLAALLDAARRLAA